MEVPPDAALPLRMAADPDKPTLSERFTRAVIKADSAVPHGRVIHVLDLLKTAKVAKIAFGVTPVSPMGVPPTP